MKEQKNQKAPEHITSTYLRYIGLRNQKIADLRVFLSNPSGIGDHANISGAVEEIVKLIDDYDSVCTTLEKLFPNIRTQVFGPLASSQRTQEQPAPQTAAPKQPTSKPSVKVASPQTKAPQKQNQTPQVKDKKRKTENPAKMFFNLNEGEKLIIEDPNVTQED